MVVFLATSFCFSEKAAAATSTLRGAAWWGDALGYLYFNCKDSVIGDRLDEEGNFRGSSTPPGFRFYSEPCTSINHRVQINENGNFSGYAWNSYKGLVAFEATTTPDSTPTPDSKGSLSNCQDTTCFNDSSCWACYNENDQKVYGWARVTSDGSWIKLDGSATALQIKSWNEASSTIPWIGYEKAGTFVGYASSTDINFNCLTGDDCSSPYEVYIENLQIGNLKAPELPYSTACGAGGALRAFLSWDLKSGTTSLIDDTFRELQTGYKIEIKEKLSQNPEDFTSPTCTIEDTDSQARIYTVSNASGSCNGALNYGRNYYWRIKLYYLTKDSTPIASSTAWYYYNSNNDLDTDKNSDGDPKTFTTFKHEFPSPFFSWSPLKPEIGSSTEFISASSSDFTKYYPSDYESGQPCSTSTCSYLWTTTDSLATITTPTNSSTTIFFKATSTYVTLKVTDNNDNYFCSFTSAAIKINFGLPIWREVRAE